MLAKNSTISGAVTRSAFAGVSWNSSNLSTSRPKQLPIATTLSAKALPSILRPNPCSQLAAPTGQASLLHRDISMRQALP
jgi:hypothetical protein